MIIASVGSLMHAGGGIQEGPNPKANKEGPEKERPQETVSPRFGVRLLEIQGLGNGEPTLTPSAEANHDQKKGVRIGESRIPAQAEQEK